MFRPRNASVALGAILMALALLLAGGWVARAQDATPAAGGADAAHPAHIHSGTCDELGEVVFPLAPISATGMTGTVDGATPTTGETMGAETAARVEVSETLVEATLADIVEGGHAINVHESETNIETYVACGDIGGMTPAFEQERQRRGGAGEGGAPRPEAEQAAAVEAADHGS